MRRALPFRIWLMRRLASLRTNVDKSTQPGLSSDASACRFLGGCSCRLCKLAQCRGRRVSLMLGVVGLVSSPQLGREPRDRIYQTLSAHVEPIDEPCASGYLALCGGVYQIGYSSPGAMRRYEER